jgi:hypothetical protein
MAEPRQLQKEIELMTNPTFILEVNGIFYPVIRLGLIKDQHAYTTILNNESPLVLGLDIIEDSTHGLTIQAEYKDNALDNDFAMLNELRKLAQISQHDYYGLESLSQKVNNVTRLQWFKPRLFRRIVDN